MQRLYGQKRWMPPGPEVCKQFDDYEDIYSLDQCQRDYRRVAGEKYSWLDAQNEGGYAALQRKITSAIASGKGASFIRLGDGEGNVLSDHLDSYPELQQFCLAKISRICFGDPSVLLENIVSIRRNLVEAVGQADLVGGPLLGSLEASYAEPDESKDVRGICGMRGVYQAIANRDFQVASGGVWTTIRYARILLPQYSSLLSKAGRLAVISCYPDLAGKLGRYLGRQSIDSFNLPMQASIAKLRGRSNGFYPTVYEKTISDLERFQHPAVFIVAGGILAKSFCTVIKRYGSVAIDVGSVADIWMGIKSRPGFSDNLVKKWKLS